MSSPRTLCREMVELKKEGVLEGKCDCLYAFRLDILHIFYCLGVDINYIYTKIKCSVYVG